jgi:hypothetical protein
MHGKVDMANSWTPVEDVQSLYNEKLASSGLSPGDGKALGFSFLTREEARAEGIIFAGHALPLLKIPYFDPFTGTPLAAGPKWPPFFRVRCLAEPVPVPKKFHKYTQPANSAACAYFPRLTDWAPLLADPTKFLLITEGELKAAKACREGYPTIGLGGVDNFRSRKDGGEMLPELEKINWVQRSVYIVYDSDIKMNPHISSAAQRLADELWQRGAIPYLITIPDIADGKSGLDDYLVANNNTAFDYLFDHAEYISSVKALFDLNKRYAVLTEGTSEVVDMRDGVKIRSEQLVYRTAKRADERRIGPNGQVVHERVNAARAWLNWMLRVEARRLVFNPALPPLALVDNDCGGYDFNTWCGFAVEPRKGDISPFLNLLAHLFTGAPKGTLDWFINWLAYPVKHPGAKLLTAVVIHGMAHGSGKTLVGETMRRVYGNAYTVIGQAELEADFNEWAGSKTFILGDDITGIDKLKIHDTLKKMVTQKVARINPKGLTAYELEDRANMLFTSNRANSFYLDRDDRRFFVWEVPESAGVLARAFYIDYLEWLDERGGAAALLHWFMHRDTKGFDPGAPALVTAAKIKMREESRSDLTNWAEDLRRDPDSMLIFGTTPVPGDLFTTKQLKAIYAAQTDIKVDDPALSGKLANALTAAGFNQVHNRGVIKAGDDRPAARYYAIRNAERWLKAPLEKIQAHLKGQNLK